MRRVSIRLLLAFSLLAVTAAGSAKELMLPSVMVGANLETTATVTLSEPAPLEGLTITITSSDPSKLRLSNTPEEAGSATITIMARGSFRVTPEFYLQGLSDSGSVTYTAKAAGFNSGSATATLAASAIVMGGPSGAKGSFRATAGSRLSKVMVFAAAIDGAGNAVPQLVAGGFSANVEIVVSDPAIGTIVPQKLTIPGGAGSALTQFQPVSQGQTTLSVSTPKGFSTAPNYGSITAMVTIPGIGVTDGVTIGQNLEVAGAVSLGSMAGKGGVRVTLASEKPDQLLISESAAAKGSGTITITVPENTVSATFYLQALGGSGQVTYSASAAGYRGRSGTITLAPSGVVLFGPMTLPEGQLLRPAAQGGARQQGFITSLAAGTPTPIKVHTVQLDPVSHRAADITIQTLRGGMDLIVDLKNTNPSAGSYDSQVTIRGGEDHANTQFVPKSEGTLELSVVPPSGFAESSNDGMLKVTVKK